jgi:hypothetical protein
MAEVGIGVLFAIWFIVIYLLVSRFRKRDKQLYGQVSLAPLDSARSIGAPPQSKRFLTTQEMSQHHAPKTGQVGDET